jgi:hypothetical protein
MSRRRICFAHLRDALDLVKCRTIEHRLIFIKSWNEWAEGNYLEPDQKFGHDYLEVVREEVLGPAAMLPWKEMRPQGELPDLNP